MTAEARFKVKQYRYELAALHDFIVYCQSVQTISPHVRNAVLERIGIVNKELKILQPKGAKTHAISNS